MTSSGIYELVLRRFLATLAPDARWKTLKSPVRCRRRGIYHDRWPADRTGLAHRLPVQRGAGDVSCPRLSRVRHLPIKKVTLDEKETQPPARYSQSKLIQRMEELGLGTKSTRHEVIAKLVSRKYVEGTPLRPTLVGRVVTESLEQHADIDHKTRHDPDASKPTCSRSRRASGHGKT